MSEQANKLRHRKLNITRPTYSEGESFDYRTTHQFKIACEEVLKVVKKSRCLSIGAISRHFNGEMRFPLIEILECLREAGKVSFEQTGMITRVLAGGKEIKPVGKFKFGR